MATANFSKVNADKYYVIFDNEMHEDEDGEMKEYQRDEYDFEDIMSNIRYQGKSGDMPFPYNCDNEWDSNMSARKICDNLLHHQFGKGKMRIANVTTASAIFIRSGYYSDAVLDYDITIFMDNGYDYSLSECDGCAEDLIDSVINGMKEHMEWVGSQDKCNVGTLHIQEKNIRRYLEKIIQTEIDKCEKFCKQNCEKIYVVSERFSNGETWYTEVK